MSLVSIVCDGTMLMVGLMPNLGFVCVCVPLSACHKNLFTDVYLDLEVYYMT